MAALNLTLRGLFSSLLLASSVACGGGGGSSPTQPEELARSQPVLVVAYGDSTQAGLSTATPQVVVPADIAQQVLRDELQRSDITVQSEGVGGTTSGQLLNGTLNSAPWSQRMQTSSAQIVTINHAINDASINRGTTDEGYRTNLTQLVSIAQAAGKTVILETPNPIVAGAPLSAGFDLAGFARKVGVMHQVATATGATLCDEYAQITQQGMDTLRWIPDGVHPHPALYQAKGKMLADCIAKVIPHS